MGKGRKAERIREKKEEGDSKKNGRRGGKK